MRKVTFGVANSLDNHIAREDHGIDWILAGEEALSAMTECKAFKNGCVLVRYRVKH